MKKLLLLTVVSSLVAASAFADIERATKPEAQAMVKKAVALLKAKGADSAFAEFDNKGGKFTDRDLYVVVYDINGKCLAHGTNPKLIGKDLIDAHDVDGKAYVQERVVLAKTHDSFWHEYKFADPITKKIAPKETYCEHVGNNIVCAGVYK